VHIWLITIGEPLPIDSGSPRLYRTGVLAHLLAQQGHDVLWWTSTFDHFRRLQRYDRTIRIKVSELESIMLLHSSGYRKNVSLRRLIDHYGLAREFSRSAAFEQRPDIILCSLPTLELSYAAAAFGRKYGIPVVLDVRDLWPDIFEDVAPRWMRRIMRYMLYPLTRTARRACRDATAIIGTTPAFVQWGLEHANRQRTSWDRDFPMAYREQSPGEHEVQAATERWRRQGVRSEDFNICFFGTIGRQFDLDTVIDAANELSGGERRFRFILCGSGERLDLYRERSAGLDSVIFPGWINEAEIWVLMRMCRVGLAPYRNVPNFTMNLPNKPFEYLSAGLPIVSSLKGVLEGLLAEHHCGITYEDGNRQELASVLCRLYDDPHHLRGLAEHARSLFENKFTAAKVYGDLISHLDRLSKTHK